MDETFVAIGMVARKSGAFCELEGLLANEASRPISVETGLTAVHIAWSQSEGAAGVQLSTGYADGRIDKFVFMVDFGDLR